MPHQVVSESAESPQQLADVFGGPVYVPRPWPPWIAAPVRYRVDTIPEPGKCYYLAHTLAQEGPRLMIIGSQEPPTFRAGEFGSPTQRWFGVPELASDQAIALVKPDGGVQLVLSKPMQVHLSGNHNLEEAIETARSLQCFTPS